MSEKIKVYYDYEWEIDEDGVGLNITLYPTKDREELLEYHVDEESILHRINDLVEYAESVDDFNFQKFEKINNHDMVVFTEMKRSGKLEEYLCGAVNDDNDIEKWEDVFPTLNEMVANRIEEEHRDDEELY